MLTAAEQVLDFPFRDRGRYFEDFEVGQTFRHHWGRTLTETDAVLYNALCLNYNPLYGNVTHARVLGHDRLPINPYLVFLTVLGLSVEDTSEREGGMFLGVERVEFLLDVYPGDTVNATSEVTATRDSRSRPTNGIVSWRTTGFNQQGAAVLAFKRTNLVARRGL